MDGCGPRARRLGPGTMLLGPLRCEFRAIHRQGDREDDFPASFTQTEFKMAHLGVCTHTGTDARCTLRQLGMILNRKRFFTISQRTMTRMSCRVVESSSLACGWNRGMRL